MDSQSTGVLPSLVIGEFASGRKMPRLKKKRKQITKQDATKGRGITVPKWMLTVPETLSDEEFQEQRNWVAALYPDEVVQKIANAGRLPSDLNLIDLRNFLIETGWIFIDQRNDRHIRASFAPDRTQLNQIALYADKLEIVLATLSDVSARSFWHPFHNLSLLINSTNMDSHVTDFGLTINKYQCADGSMEIRHLRPHQIEEAIHVIRRLAEDAASGLPKQSGGQPQYSARLLWVLNAQMFWRKHSTIAFDFRSRALEFCYEAFRPLDASATQQQISSAMRAANKLRPAKRTNAAKARTRIPKK